MVQVIIGADWCRGLHGELAHTAVSWAAITILSPVAHAIAAIGVCRINDTFAIRFPASRVVAMNRHLWREVDRIVVSSGAAAMPRSIVDPCAYCIGKRGCKVLTHGADPNGGVCSCMRRGKLPLSSILVTFDGRIVCSQPGVFSVMAHTVSLAVLICKCALRARDVISVGKNRAWLTI
jgi:hypothetical protein